MRNAITTTFMAALFLLAAQGRGLAASFDFFAGSWECTTDAGSKTFLLYHPVLNNEWLVLENTWVNSPAQAVGEFIEYYRYDQSNGKWWATSMGSNGLLEVSSSPDWKNDQLIFEGSANFPGGSYGSRELYTRWKDGTTLERAHEQLTGFGWVKSSHSLCHRAKQS
jgi:hypothetical protein